MEILEAYLEEHTADASAVTDIGAVREYEEMRMEPVSYTHLDVYKRQPVTEAQICEKVKEELDGLRMFCEIGEGSIAVDETEDIDWINNWKHCLLYTSDVYKRQGVVRLRECVACSNLINHK